MAYDYVKGTNQTITMYCRNLDSTPVDITGKTITVDLPAADGLVIAKTGTVTDGPNGIFTLPLLAADNLLLALDIQIDVILTDGGSYNRIFPQIDGLSVTQKSY